MSRYYELIKHGWEGNEHHGFFKSIEECVMHRDEWSGISDKDIVVWDFVDGLPVKAGKVNVIFDEFDEYFERDKPTSDTHTMEEELFGYTIEHYTFDDGVVTLVKTQGV